MTKIQTAEIAPGVVTVAIGASGSPYIMVERVTPQGNNTLVPFEYGFARLLCLIDKGYTLSDPHSLVTCPGCGEWKLWTLNECDACAKEEADRRDDRQMYSELRGGM